MGTWQASAAQMHAANSQSSWQGSRSHGQDRSRGGKRCCWQGWLRGGHRRRGSWGGRGRPRCCKSRWCWLLRRLRQGLLLPLSRLGLQQWAMGSSLVKSSSPPRGSSLHSNGIQPSTQHTFMSLAPTPMPHCPHLRLLALPVGRRAGALGGGPAGPSLPLLINRGPLGPTRLHLGPRVWLYLW